MADPVRRSLPSATHFREHRDSIAGRRQQLAFDAAVRRVDLARSEQDDNETLLWLELNENSTEEQVAAAARQLRSWSEPRRPDTPSRVIPHTRTVRSCSLDARWPRWDIVRGPATDCRLLDDDQHRTCETARLRRPVQHRGELSMGWEHGAGGNGLIHGEAMVGSVLLHVDKVTLDRSGPGRRIQEIRLFADGELCGRGGSVGCSLGAGGEDLPAVGLIGPDLAVTADLVHGDPITIVELWEVA